MKILNKLAVMLVAMGLTVAASTGFAATSAEEQIAERIAPVGKICLEGMECGVAAAASAASSEPRSGDEVYNSSCAGCHGAGVMGAPKLGDATDWAKRSGQGLEMLIDHAINGFNAMPPKGGCGSCSNDEIKGAVEHMLANSK